MKTAIILAITLALAGCTYPTYNTTTNVTAAPQPGVELFVVEGSCDEPGTFTGHSTAADCEPDSFREVGCAQYEVVNDPSPPGYACVPPQCQGDPQPGFVWAQVWQCIAKAGTTVHNTCTTYIDQDSGTYSLPDIGLCDCDGGDVCGPHFSF